MIFLSVNGSAFYNAYSKKLLVRFCRSRCCSTATTRSSPHAAHHLKTEPGAFRSLAHFSFVVWLGLMGLALFQYFLSMVIFLNVLTRLDATQAGLSNYLIPFFGVLIAAPSCTSG